MEQIVTLLQLKESAFDIHINFVICRRPFHFFMLLPLSLKCNSHAHLYSKHTYVKVRM